MIHLAEEGLKIQDLRLQNLQDLRLWLLYAQHLILNLRRIPVWSHVLLADSPLYQLVEIQEELFEINLILINKIKADAGGTPAED